MGNVQVSDALLEAMRREAEAAGDDVNRLFEEAAEKLLRHRHLDDLAKYGQAQVRRLKLKSTDAVRLVRELRNESHHRR